MCPPLWTNVVKDVTPGSLEVIDIRLLLHCHSTSPVLDTSLVQRIILRLFTSVLGDG